MSRKIAEVNRDTTADLFTLGIRTIHSTEIIDVHGNKYSGHGWSQEEADTQAEEKYSGLNPDTE